MRRYTAKPVVIEAEQFKADPESVPAPGAMFLQFPLHHDERGPHLLIETLEGTMRANPGDYIIRGTQGEYYPCKPEVFERKYAQLVEGVPKAVLLAGHQGGR